MPDQLPPTDSELVAQSLATPDAFAALIERYEQPLRRFIHRLTSVDDDDCQDLLQEIFIKTYRHLRGFDHRLKFSSWIYRIAHNHIISHHRKKLARPQLASAGISQDALETIAADIQLERDIDQELLRQRLNQLLNQLDSKHRDILLLRYLEERDYHEISDILQLPMGTVAARINRAKRQLRQLMSEKPQPIL